jgi:hypothetical protein
MEISKRNERQSRMSELVEDYNSSRRLMMGTLAEILVLTKNGPESAKLSRIINTLSDMFGELNRIHIRVD